ncbi:YfhD family protein [Lederbergia lenta]|uniref:YfhD protein n=1 Tax=Lederbergia lenta TaxID=1467 RepID=A0A2X4W977_LEDLE|nr:YfhD family protein [Lederbergia lenta]MCM3113384.1 YfhD family protein [Lederbergia lenta]MEC2326471.1 YfhD family protein [Lederbergia lenta]SQI61207.1 YfhD protein [Lederbergia lenta]
MGRDDRRKARDKNKQKLPQVPKNMKSDGMDVEFSTEMADNNDREAMARSKAADNRAKKK